MTYTTMTARLEESRNRALDAAEEAQRSINVSNATVAQNRIALAAVYTDIYRADVIRAQGDK